MERFWKSKGKVFRVVSLVLVAGFLLLPPGAAMLEDSGKGNRREITLEEAKERALEFNRQVDIMLLKVQEADLGVEAVEEALDDLRSERRDVRRRIRDAESSLDALQDKLAELHDELEALLALNSSGDNGGDNNGGDNNGEEGDNADNDDGDLAEKIAELQGKIAGAQMEVMELRALIPVLEGSLEMLEQQIDDLEIQEKQAERGVEIARLALEETREKVLLSLEEMFAGILLWEEQRELHAETLAHLEDLLRMQEGRQEAGLITELEVEELRARVREARTGGEKLSYRMEQASQALALFLGLPAETEFNLEPFTPTEPSSVEYNALLKEEREQNWAVRRAELALENAWDERERAREEHGRRSAFYEQADVAVSRAELELEQERDDAQAALLEDYHAHEESRLELANREGDVELARLKYAEKEARFDAGQVIAAELAGAGLELLEKKLDRESARYHYHNARAVLDARLER